MDWCLLGVADMGSPAGIEGDSSGFDDSAVDRFLAAVEDTERGVPAGV